MISTNMTQVIDANNDKLACSMYGYKPNANDVEGCDINVGSDHGQGTCTCSLKMNLQSPTKRQAYGNHVY